MSKIISIICPIYNEADSICFFYDRVNNLFSKIDNQYTARIIFINNCSTDNSIELITNISNKDPRVKYLSYSRNFFT